MPKIPQILREIIQKEKMSIYRVARAIHVDHGSLYRTLKDDGNPEGKTIEKILDYLGYEVKVFKKKNRKKT